MIKGLNKATVAMRELGDAFYDMLCTKGTRVAYYTEQSATEPEQAGLVYADRGTVLSDYDRQRKMVYVQWDKGFIHAVSIHNIRLLELLEELCDEPPEPQV